MVVEEDVWNTEDRGGRVGLEGLVDDDLVGVGDGKDDGNAIGELDRVVVDEDCSGQKLEPHLCGRLRGAGVHRGNEGSAVVCLDAVIEDLERGFNFR